MKKNALCYNSTQKTKNYIEKAMTETVVYPEHTERAAFGGSCLCKRYMKTIPELCVEEIKVLKRYRVAAL